MLTELEVMKSMQPHPHVVRLIGCRTEKGTGLIKTMKFLLDVICLIFKKINMRQIIQTSALFILLTRTADSQNNRTDL